MQLISVFSGKDNKSLYILNLKPVATFWDCTASFVSELVGNHEDKVSIRDSNTV